jgi:prolipoprotein diacylglyceryltransferase
MRRILFRWNGVDIYSFPVMLYFGLLAGIFVGAYFAHRTGLDADRFIAATLILLVPMMIGARLLFVATHWALYARDLRRIWRRSEGGLSMYGGFSIAVPLSLPLLRWLELPFGAFWDAATFMVLTVLGFAKVGCLLNGCCSGRPTGAWYGLELADHHGMAQRRVPSQLLELACFAILFAMATTLRPHAPFPGAVFCATAVAYGVARYFLQTLRDEPSERHAGLIRLLVTGSLAATLIVIFSNWPL